MAYRATERTRPAPPTPASGSCAPRSSSSPTAATPRRRCRPWPRRAGVATGSVYRHFPSKAELFAEVFRRAAQREVDAVAGAAGGPERTPRIA